MINYKISTLFKTAFLLIAFSAKAQEVIPDNQSKFSDFTNRSSTEFRSASGKPGPSYWQNKASYVIESELFPETSILKGKVTLTYTNNSSESLDYIWMYLEQNRYTKDSRGTITSPTNDRYLGDIDGGFAITNLSATIGKSINSFSKNIISDTRMQIFFNNPIPAKGGIATVSMNFEFKIPKDGMDRMGKLETKNGTIFSVAQWYPRVAVFDDVVGWNTEPYLGAGEFYCEYGNYDYKITVPYDQIVVGSGTLVNPTEVLTQTQIKRLAQAAINDKTTMIIPSEEVGNTTVTRPKSSGKTTWHFTMINTRDVAFGVSKAFIWDAARINLPNKKTALAQSVYYDEVKGQQKWSRSTEYVKASIEHYSSMWFEYPYPNAVNVASNVGGMEYPGLSFCDYKETNNGLWEVTDHEFGHNWFPMIVGSNERRYAWMDEGFNTFINYYSTKAFNNQEYKSYLDNIDITQWLKSPAREGIDTYPDVSKDYNLGFNAYFKPAKGLQLLREYILGNERFDNAFKTYIKTWAYKHPQPNDFFNTIDNVAGENLNWFWKGWFYGNGNIDLAIKSVDTKNGNYILTLENKGQIPMPVLFEIKYKNGNKERRTLPVEIWQKQNEFSYTIISNSELESITIDPDKLIPDLDTANNSWKSN
jgi:hypothetical protein